MTLGKRIHDLRKAFGLTQQQLADRAGVKRETIQRIETGTQTDITFKTAYRIAVAFGISTDALGKDVYIDEGHV